MNPLPTAPIDENLATLRAGKTSAACAKIVALHGPLVKSACRRVLRDEGLAEDAAQETFVLLVKKAPSLPPNTSLAGWLYHAACRTALNHQRAAMRRRVRENSTEAMNQMIPDSQPNLWNEIEPHLDDAMLALPERQRDLVVQCYFQNQSQRSAAAAMGCSESVVSRELNAAIEALRQFFARRRVAVSGVVLAGLLPAHAASATALGSSATVTAMMATTTTTSSAMIAALMQSKLLLASIAVVGTAAVATAGYHLASTKTKIPEHTATGPVRSATGKSTGAGSTAITGNGASPGGTAGVSRQGKWDASFQFTSAMALDERKKQVLLESDPNLRYAMLQKMGVGLSRAAFDQLIAKGMDASVAPWRDTFTLLANHTDAFDNYLMAWSNEDPLAALNWVAAQPDNGVGMRRQLLYALAANQLQPEALREWINGLTVKSEQHEATIALESIGNPASVVARMGTGDNDGFLVDLAMLQGGENLDWTAFGRKLATAKPAIVARAMRLALDEKVPSPHLDEMIQELAHSTNPNIGLGAATILRATRGDADIDYPGALQLATACDQAGMSNFSSSIFRGWAVADPQAALRYAAALKDLSGMRDVIHGMPNLPDEATFLAWMASSPAKARDIALACLYGRETDTPFAQLQKITQSTTVTDQVEAAQEVMRMMPLPDVPAAATWLKQLPPGKNRQELAMSLVRRLAAVDPPATLDLVQSEGLKGEEFERVVYNAVTQFAAQNDLDQSTQFIQQINDPRMYAEALGQLAMVKFPGHPHEAFVYLQNNAHGDWQPAALRMLSDFYYNKLGNIDANAAEILKLDLPRLGPAAAERASSLCQIWIDNHAPVAEPLAWTQQLPDPIGSDTRLQLAKSKELKPVNMAQIQAWALTAAISPAERDKLVAVLGRRLGSQASR